MKRSEGLLKRPVYVALAWLIAIAFIVAVPGRNLARDYYKSEAENKAHAIPMSQGIAQITKIRNEALAKGRLSAPEYALAVVKIREIEHRTGETLSDSVTGLAKLIDITYMSAKDSSNYGYGGIANVVQEVEAKYYHREGGTAFSWSILGGILNTLWVGCWFIPLAFLILVLRLATVARTRKQLLAMIKADQWELIGASLFWGGGLEHYRPDKSLFYKIAELGYREDEDVATDWAQKRIHMLELINRGRFDAISPLQTIWAMLKVVWGGSWRQASLGLRFSYARQAVYVSLVGAFMVMAGQVRAYASGDGIVLQNIMINYNRNLSLGGPASENLFLTFRGGVYAGIYGYSTPHPVFELSYDATRLKLPNGSLTLGPFVDYSDDGKLLSYGAAGFAAIKLASGMLTGPVYFTKDPQGNNGFLAPNTRLTWSAGKNLSYGLGGAAFASDGNKPTFLLGPILNIKGKTTMLMIRLGQFLSGPSRGQTQLRLDFAFTP